MRLDFLGLGDSLHPNPEKEHNPYMPEAVENVQQTIHFLRQVHGINNVVLMGLCSGAYVSFQSALHLDEDVIHEIFPINPLTFYWKDGMSLDVAPSEYYFSWDGYQQSVWKKSKWKKLLSGEKKVTEVLSTVAVIVWLKFTAFINPLIHRLKWMIGIRNIEDLAWDLDIIAKRGIKINFIFADTDPGIKLLKEGAGKTVDKLRDKNMLTDSFISKANHNFSSHRGRTQLLGLINRFFTK